MYNTPSKDYPVSNKHFIHPNKIQLTYGCGTSQAVLI